MLLRLRLLLGSVLNSIGFPGLVQDAEYEAGICEGRITVKRLGLFTVITVNGLDVYFHRLSGKIDGVGLSRAADYKRGASLESAHPVWLPESLRALTQTQTE
jgi:hypothetical protein